MRRPYQRVDIYEDEELVALKAHLVHDNQRGTLEVKERDDRNRWVVTRTYDVTGVTSERVDRTQVYTWTLADGGTVRGVKAGCGCGR